MRRKRGFLLFFIPIFLLALIGIGYAYFDYSQITESQLLNYPEKDHYGAHFGRLKGDLSASGIPGNDSWRPAFLDRYQATFTENIKTGASYPLVKYDNYNLEETQPTDNFMEQHKEGYGLLPIDQKVIQTFLSQYVNATPEQQLNISDKILDYQQKYRFDAYGYYELDGNPYYSIPELVAMAGGKLVDSHSTSTDLSDMSKIKGEATFYLSPGPEINSASISGTQLTVDFNALGYSSRDIQLEVKGDKGTKNYTYYDVTDTTFHDTWTKDVSDFSSQTGTNNLQVIIHDGFWRTDQANIQRPLNLAVMDIQYSPPSIRPNDQIQVSVLVTNQSSKDITTDLVESVNGNGGGTKIITVPAVSSIWVDGFPVKAPFDSSVNIAFDVNKSRTQPSSETNWTDNHIDKDVPIDNTENLYIHFRDLSESVQWNDNIPVKIVVGNTSDHPITTTVTLQEDYKYSYSQCVATDENDHCIKWKWITEPKVGGDSRTITVPARDEYVYTVKMPAGWDYFDQGENQYVVTFTGNVNPSHSQPNDEISYLDNTVTDEVHVNPIGVPKIKVRLYE